MKKSISNIFFTVLIATPFLALGSLVHAVTPLNTAPSPSMVTHPVMEHGLHSVSAARQVMGHLETANWLQLPVELTATGTLIHKSQQVIRTWSL